MPYIIDTCIWVAYFKEDDSCYEKARDIIASKLAENDSEMSKNIFVPPEVLLETTNTIKKLANKYVAREFLKFVETDTRISTMPLGYLDFLDKAINWYMKQDGSLSLNDLVLVAMSIYHDFDFLTFDKKLYEFYQSQR